MSATGPVQGLFRRQVLETRRDDQSSANSFSFPAALKWSLLLVAGAAVAVSGLLAVASYTRRATLEGVVAPDVALSRLYAVATGSVVARPVTQGQTVRRGDVLYVLAPMQGALADGAQSDVARSLDERRHSLERARRVQDELVASGAAALDRRLRALAAEREHLEAELAAHTQRLALARESLVRQQALVAQQYISPAQLQARQEEVLAVEAQGPALRRQRAALDREQAELEGERRNLPLRSEQVRGEFSRGLAQLARETAEQPPERQIVVRAPHDGVVGAVLAHAGQSVLEGSPLVTLLPANASLHIELLAPTSAIGLMKLQQPVRVRYEAFPFQRFGQHTATVVDVARVPLSPAELAALPLSSGTPAPGQPIEPMFRVTVQLDAAPGPAMPGPLLAGMRVQADVLLERRRWIEWMLAPALGVASRL